MNASDAIADSLLPRAFGQWARPSGSRRTHEYASGSQGSALVSRRGSAISRRTVM